MVGNKEDDLDPETSRWSTGTSEAASVEDVIPLVAYVLQIFEKRIKNLDKSLLDSGKLFIALGANNTQSKICFNVNLPSLSFASMAKNQFITLFSNLSSLKYPTSAMSNGTCDLGIQLLDALVRGGAVFAGDSTFNMDAVVVVVVVDIDVIVLDVNILSLPVLLELLVLI